jgi:hypothetical protein
MAAIATVKIDLSKIDKSKIFEGKNGSKYYEFTLSINDKTSEYGDNISATESQTKEQRDNKEKKSFIGGGKVIWVGDGISVAEKRGSLTTASAPNDDSLPF